MDLPAYDGPASDPQAGDLGALIGAAAPIPSWEEWWSFNQDAYLDLKRAIGAGSPATGADEIVAGRVRQKPPTLEIVRSRVLPVLRGIVETEKAAPLVGGAMIALARAGADDADDSGPAAIAILQRRLADPNQELAETATLALGILASEDGLPALEALLAGGPRGRELVGGHEVPDRLRAFAAYGLGLVAHRAENHRARQVVARALCAALDVPRISRASTPDVEIAAAIGLSLGALEPESRPSSSAPWISRQTEIRFLQGVFHDRTRRSLVRAHAVTALARLAQGAPEELASEVVDDLLAAVRTKSKIENEVLQSVAQALGYLGDADSDLRDRRIRNALGQLLDDADVQTRNFALVALAEVGSRGSENAATGEDEGTVGCRNLITGELVRGRGLTRPWAAMALGVLERRLLDRADAKANRAPAIAASGSRAGSGSSKTSRELLRR
jgi:HEAT repeat protein